MLLVIFLGFHCVASKRIYVYKDIYTESLSAMTEVVRSWKVSPSTVDSGNMLGLINLFLGVVWLISANLNCDLNLSHYAWILLSPCSLRYLLGKSCRRRN